MSSIEYDINVLKKAYHDYGKQVIFPNMRERIVLYEKMEQDPELAALLREKCRRDCVYWINYFVFTHEPRPHYLKWYGLKNATIPFVLFPFQEKFVRNMIDHIDHGKGLLVEKSRDMGASWMVLTVITWYWLFGGSGNDFLLGSRKYDYVDKRGRTDTLFQKVRYILEKLVNIAPGFMPNGYNVKKHDNVGMIVNPETGSFLAGEANNENFGTSGRYKGVMLDEFSKWLETDAAAWTSIQDATAAPIVVSTPYGIGRKFSQLRFSGAIDVETLHWSDHPLKSAGRFRGAHPFDPEKRNVWLSPWYLMECERRKDDPATNVGQELDIDYITSGTPFFRFQMQYIQDKFKRLEEEGFQGKRYEFRRTGDNSIEVFEFPEGRIFVRKEPEEGWLYRYCIPADVAEGLEKGDNSSMYVYDRYTGEDVAWFVGKVDTFVFALLLEYYGFRYNEAYIAPEANNQGKAVLQELKFRYENLYHKQDFSYVADIDKKELGFHTNVASKPIVCSKLQKALANEVDGVFDRYFFNEAMTFIHDPTNGKLGASGTAKDDRVMAQAIKWALHEWLPAPEAVEEFHDPNYGKHRFGIKTDKTGDIRQIWR